MKWAELNERERDVLIHEKVMGKTEPEICEFDPRMTVMTSGSEPDSFDWRCYKCGAYGKVTRDGYYQHQKAIPHYTISMDAAWQVVEKFKQEGRGGYFFIQWQYYLGKLYERPSYRDTLFDLNPDGVCLAALRAVGIDVEV